MNVDWSMLTGPLIGAVIGYFTNYLAVKMLFRPRREIRVLGRRVPFTPGVIPKGKARLARVIGRTVADTLVTGEDVKRALLSEKTQDAVADRLVNTLSGKLGSQLRRISGLTEAEYIKSREHAVTALSMQIADAIQTMPLQEKVSEAMMNHVREKLDEIGSDNMMGSMIAMMLPEERIASFVDPVSAKIQRYVDRHGMEFIRPALEDKLDELESSSGKELLDSMEIREEAVRHAIKSLYRHVVEEHAQGMLAQFDLAGLIEDKVNAMDVMELESLVLSVMKKELNTIVSLGALIGLIIGILNIFV